MSIVLTLLGIVVPVFLVVGAGYASVRSGFMGDEVINPLVKYGTGFAIPCLLFLAMYRLDLGGAIHVGALVAFFGSGTAVFLAGMALSRLVWKRRPGEAVVVGFVALFSNVVMLGIPIADRAYGGAVTAAVFGVIAFHSTYNYFVGFVAMEMIRSDGQSILAGLRRAFVTTFKNPLMIGLMAGIAVNLVGLVLPGVVEQALEMIRASALPVALFSLGGVLTRYRLRDEIGEALMLSVLSLLVQPALAWLLAEHVFGLGQDYVRAVVLLAAMPAGMNGYIFATLYNRAVGTAASAALIATALSILTITGWLAFLGP